MVCDIAPATIAGLRMSMHAQQHVHALEDICGGLGGQRGGGGRGEGGCRVGGGGLRVVLSIIKSSDYCTDRPACLPCNNHEADVAGLQKKTLTVPHVLKIVRLPRLTPPCTPWTVPQHQHLAKARQWAGNRG